MNLPPDFRVLLAAFAAEKVSYLLTARVAMRYVAFPTLMSSSRSQRSANDASSRARQHRPPRDLVRSV